MWTRPDIEMIRPQLPVTFGRAGESLEIGGFRITEAAYSANARVAPHEHQFASWTAVIGGGFRERFRDGEYACQAGALLAKPATAAHSNEYGDSGAHVIIVEMIDAASETYVELAKAAQTGVRLLSGATAGVRIRRLHSALTGSGQARSLAVHAAILDIGLLLLRTQPRRVAKRAVWLRRATDRLQSDFVQPPPLWVLAAECGVHPVHLCAAFRSAHGCSPGEFVRRLRVEHARRLLATTAHAVSQVALASGFSDQSHLTRQFRAATGMTPAQYRRRAAPEDRAL